MDVDELYEDGEEEGLFVSGFREHLAVGHYRYWLSLVLVGAVLGYPGKIKSDMMAKKTCGEVDPYNFHPAWDSEGTSKFALR